MATLQDILANNNPDQLKKLLGLTPETGADQSHSISDEVPVEAEKGQILDTENFSPKSNVHSDLGDVIPQSNIHPETSYENPQHTVLDSEGNKLPEESPQSKNVESHLGDEIPHENIMDSEALEAPEKPETGFQMVGEGQASAKPDIAKLRMQAALKNNQGSLVGPSYVPTETEKKLASLPEENLRDMGFSEDLISHLKNLKYTKAGQAVESLAEKAGALAESPMGKIAGKTAAGLAVPIEANNMLGNIRKGNIADAAGNAVGAGAGIAALAGSSLAAPLGAITAAKAAGDLVDSAMGGPHGPDLPPTKGGVTTPPVSPPGQAGTVLAGFRPDENSKMGPTDAELADSRNTPAPEKEDEEDRSPATGSSKKHLAGLHAKGSEGGTAEQNARLMAVMNGGSTINTLDNLRQAQDQANNLKLAGMLGQGITQISQGIVGSKYGATPQDNTKDFYKQYQENANQPVEQFKALGEQEKNDPASGPSQQASAFAQQMLQKAGLPPKLAEGMSYNQVEKNFPQIAKMMEANEANLNRRAMMQMKYAEMAQQKELMQNQKNQNNQDKAMMQTRQLLESARGNPAAAQAERDIYSADKAKSLASLYGDPNKLNPAMVQLLSSEVAKIAQGGTPTMHELEGLTPQTLQSKFAGIAQKLINEPSSANAGAFVKQYQDYANALTKDAQKVITDKYGRVIESGKKQLGDENYNTLKKEYENRFNITPSGEPQSGKSLGGKQDPKISDYATKHGLDYTSAKTLLVNRGYKPQE